MIDTISHEHLALLRSIFLKMAAGITISGIAGYLLYLFPDFTMMLFSIPFLFLGLIIIEIGLVIYLSARLEKMSVTSAYASYILYCIVSGITLYLIILGYVPSSVAAIFFSTVLYFLALAYLGTTIKYDMRPKTRLMYGSLLGVIIASVVNMYFRSSILDMALSVLSLGIFTYLTISVVQQIVTIDISSLSDEQKEKIKISFALSLYLKFVNLFLDLLRLFGRRK